MALNDGIVVKHTADRMKAYVALAKNFGPYTANVVLTELLQHGIVHGLNTAMVHKFIAAGLFDKYVEVAAGTPVTAGADGRIEILVSLPQPDTTAGNSAEFVNVKSGAALARRVPPTPGVNGMDVFGGVMNAPPVKDVPLLGGKGTTVKPDNPDQLFAAHDGTFYHKPDGEIEVRHFMKVDGDVDSGMGSVTFKGDLLILGAVASDTSVEASGAVVIHGMVQNASIKCGGDLTLHSPVVGGPASDIQCGGSVKARGIERTKVTAGGDITASEDIAGCDIMCNGVLKARSIAGGSVTAAGGVCADQIGSGAGARTVVDVSTFHNYVKKCDDIKSGIEQQNTMSEKHVSTLYRFVRDNMDESGELPADSVPTLNDYIKSLKESVALGDNMEKDLHELNAALEAIAGCNVTAREVYPNVQIKLGFSEQNITEVTTNVSLKPQAA